MSVSCDLTPIQCDENRPVCGNCERHFVEIEACDYTPTVTRPRTGKKSTTTAETPTAAELSSSQMITPILIDSPSPNSGLVAPEALDPFCTHPTCSAPDVNRLMNHCKSYTIEMALEADFGQN